MDLFCKTCHNEGQVESGSWHEYIHWCYCGCPFGKALRIKERMNSSKTLVEIIEAQIQRNPNFLKE